MNESDYEEMAEELIHDFGRDVDYLSVIEIFDDVELTEGDVRSVLDKVRTAKITVTW